MPTSLSGSMRGGRTRKFKSEINVVPYIDVMLVLLVIFMVAAPMTNPGVINLPSAETHRDRIFYRGRHVFFRNHNLPAPKACRDRMIAPLRTLSDLACDGFGCEGGGP